MGTAYRSDAEPSGDPVLNRRPTNVSLPADQLAAAKELGINVSRACGEGLRAAVKNERERRWREDNLEAIEERVRYVEAHGLPLETLRMFDVE